MGITPELRPLPVNVGHDGHEEIPSVQGGVSHGLKVLFVTRT